MKLHTEIIKETEDSTVSKLSINGEFFCYVLEDGYNSPKVWGETRIPHGVYPIESRKNGKHYKKYVHRFDHEFSLWVRYVTNFSKIMIHVGNSVIDTHGCLLVGEKWAMKGEDYGIYSSTKAYKKLYETLKKAFEKGEEVIIAMDRSGSKYEQHEAINPSKIDDQ